MKPFAILCLAVVAAAGTAFLVTAVRPSGPNAAASNTAVTPEGDWQKSLRALEERNTELTKAVEELRMELAKKNEAPRVPLGEIDAAVARALEGKKGAADAGGASKPVTTAATGSKLDAKTAFEKLMAQGLSWEDSQALWKAADEAGVLKDVIAMFEDRAKQNPNDPKAQVELGKAYLQKVYKAQGPEAGIWATKADKAFDKALAIDDHDWEARFSKAVSLSFWPPVMGKQGEAIQQFETLVKQQEGLASSPQYAQTHLLLGNMYSQMGQKDKALAAWQKGLALFPDSAELKKQVELAQSSAGQPH